MKSSWESKWHAIFKSFILKCGGWIKVLKLFRLRINLLAPDNLLINKYDDKYWSEEKSACFIAPFLSKRSISIVQAWKSAPLKGLYQCERWKFACYSGIFLNKNSQLNFSENYEHIWLYLTYRTSFFYKKVLRSERLMGCLRRRQKKVPPLLTWFRPIE